MSMQVTPFEATEQLPQLLRLGDLLDKWEAEAESLHEAYTTGKPRGPQTGLKTVDEALGNVLAPGVHTLHGPPGIGKTALVLQIASNCGFPALFVTTEMTPLELLRRLTARITNTFLGKLKSGEKTLEESLSLVRRTIAAVPELALADAAQVYATPEWITESARAIKGDAPHILVVLDNVHNWADMNPLQAVEYDRLNEAIASLRVLSRALNCPVIMVAERNRASMEKGGLSAAAGTRRFEYSGESVLDLSPRKDSVTTLSGEVEMTLTIAKNRHGLTGKKLELIFHGALQEFSEAE